MQRFWWLLGLALYGCQGGGPAAPTATASAHVHEHHAPHGGSLVELGEEAAHLEVLWDAAQAKVTIYVLDGEAEQPVRLKDRQLRLQGPGGVVSLEAQANPLTGETVGDSSQFVGVIPEFKGKSEWKASVPAISVLGRSYTEVTIDYPHSGH